MSGSSDLAFIYHACLTLLSCFGGVTRQRIDFIMLTGFQSQVKYCRQEVRNLTSAPLMTFFVNYRKLSNILLGIRLASQNMQFQPQGLAITAHKYAPSPSPPRFLIFFFFYDVAMCAFWK